MSFKIGEKVVPKSKTVVGDLESSVVWKSAQEMGQPFLYVSGIDSDDTFVCIDDIKKSGGDYFHRRDLVPYDENSLEVGMKVVPKNKSKGKHGLANSNVWKDANEKGQSYIYITRFDSGGVVVCDHRKGSHSGDYFHKSDLVPYIEKAKGEVTLTKKVSVEAGDVLVLGNRENRLIVLGADNQIHAVDTVDYKVRGIFQSFERLNEFYNDELFGGILEVVKRENMIF